MYPQKIPSWANEAPVQPFNVEKINKTEELKHELSDMEWMQQRMSKHVDQENDVKQLDGEGHATPSNKLVRSDYLHTFLFTSRLHSVARGPGRTCETRPSNRCK